MRVQAIRVTPGPHRLRLTYEGSSASHRGQQDVVFLLDTDAGHQYDFEPKTCGISGARPWLSTLDRGLLHNPHLSRSRAQRPATDTKDAQM